MSLSVSPAPAEAPLVLSALRPRTVVLGYDGSEAARRGVARAAEAAGAGGRVVVVTVVPPPGAPELEPDLPPSGEPERLLREAEALLPLDDVEVAVRVVEGNPADALVAAAHEAGADLIVVGARGRSFLARALRGSVAERLVARAPCDVLVAQMGSRAHWREPRLRAAS